MRRSWNSAKRTFSEAIDASVVETEAALRQRRKEMHRAWDDLDVHSKALAQRMLEVGITRPSGSEERMLRLNVGGSPVNVRRSALEGRGHLGHLFESVWDKRLPRDADGFVVLDLSPSCVKYVIHTLLNASVAAASGTPKLTLGDDLAADEKAYLPYVACALGLAEYLPISAVLEPDEFDTMVDTVLDWCPGFPADLELIYRASRDGWSPEAFHARCGDDSPSTVTLYRVSNTDRGTLDSVVGGFSSVPWTPGAQPSYRSSPGAFVFMLKDGTRTGPKSFQPAKWGIKRESIDKELYFDSGIGPSFAEDLEMGTCRSSNKPGGLIISNSAYAIPKDSPFLALNGHDVVEIETFRVCPDDTTPSTPPPKPGLMDIPSFEATATSTEGDSDEDIRSFGVFIADSLMEQKMALHQDHNELAEASARAAASADALENVYGPHVAAGEEETVVELNARGTRITTMRSTLQACPDSALAAQFDIDKWPATEKDLDERGRRLMDCSPSVLSKVLDVLRARKRAAWPAAEGSGDGDVRVVVKAADRAAFEKFVGMYFPGCESFIMDFVVNSPREPQVGS